MEEPLRWAQMLHDTPDLFPWACLAIILFIVVSQHKRILRYFDARIDAYAAKQKSDAVIAELIRNNTAALENNTAALKSVEADRGETRRMLNHHECMSKERMDAIRDDISHVQAVVNRVDETVSQNERDITVLKDRNQHRR